MINIKALEELRTKEELINYFKQLGKEITEEELNALKQSYNKAQENNGALTMQQLDDVAGGGCCHFVDIFFDKEKIGALMPDKKHHRFEIAGHIVNVIYGNGCLDKKDCTMITTNMNYDHRDIDCSVTREEFDQRLARVLPNEADRAEFYSQLGEVNTLLSLDTHLYTSLEKRQKIGFKWAVTNDFGVFLKGNTGHFFESFEAARDAFYKENRDIKSSLDHIDLHFEYELVTIRYAQGFIIRELHDNPKITKEQIEEKFMSLKPNDDLIEQFGHYLPLLYRDYTGEHKENLGMHYEEFLRDGYYSDLSADQMHHEVSAEDDVKTPLLSPSQDVAVHPTLEGFEIEEPQTGNSKGNTMLCMAGLAAIDLFAIAASTTGAVLASENNNDKKDTQAN